MALYTYHGLAYIVYWMAYAVDRGLGVAAFVLDELSDWFDCGKCTHINNLAGLISLLAGLVTPHRRPLNSSLAPHPRHFTPHRPFLLLR